MFIVLNGLTVSYLWEARDGLFTADDEEGADVISRALSDRARYTACSRITSLQFMLMELIKLVAD